MTKFLYLLSAIIFYISKYIECSKLYDALQSYYENSPRQNFQNSWQIYYKAFETEIATNLEGNFGKKAVNIYEPDRRDAHFIAGGFHLTDGVVMVYFFEMVLRELPSLLRPQLDMEISTNRVKFTSKVGQMFIDTTYYVARNSSSVIYARPEDQKELSPFSLQQVDNLGKVAIVVEDCTLSGVSIATLSGDSVNLGHNTFMLSDCKFTVEISTPNSGAPPVIAPYFPTGPKEKLEVVLSQPLRDELHTKLQSAMYSYINMSVLLGSKAADFRKSQQELFKTYNEFATGYVRDLNQKTLKANKGHVILPNYEILMNTETDKRRWQCHMALTDLTLYGLDTAYIARTGGPYAHQSENNYPGGAGNRLKPLDNAADAIMFSSMQIRGKITHDDGNGSVTHDFATELTDVEVKMILDIKQRTAKMEDILLTGWKSLEFSIIPWETKYKERHGYQSLVYGHILNELPVRVTEHLRSLLGATIEGSKQHDDGAGGGNAGKDSDAGEGNDGNEGNDEDENGSVADNDKGSNSKDKKLKEKKDGFFSDDLLDENFFSDEKFFSDDAVEKDFFSDDAVEKDFFSDDGIEKDFITDDNVKKDFMSDFEEGGKKDDGKVVADDDAAVDNVAVNDNDVKEKAVADEEAVADEKAVADEAAVADEKAVADEEGVLDKEAVVDEEAVADQEAVADDTIGNEGVNDDNNPNEAAPGTGVGVDDEDVADDVIGNEGVNDDNNPNEAAPGTGEGVDDEEVTDDVIGNEGVNDDDGKVSDDVGIASEAVVTQTDGPNVGIDDDAVKDNEENKNVKLDGFLSEDFIEKDFFSDDNIKEDFISDMSVENNDDDSPLAKKENKPSIDNDADALSIEDGDEVAANDEDDGDEKQINADGAKYEKTTSGDKVLDHDHLDNNFMSDINMEKNFFSDDNLEKDFFSDDNLEKDFFSDDNLEKDFFSDDNKKLQKGVGNKKGKLLAGKSNNNQINTADVTGKGDKVNRASGSAEDNNGEILDNASVNDKDDQNSGDLGNKKLWASKENKPFLDENFFSDEHFDRRSMANDSQRGGAKTKDKTDVKNSRNGEDDHVDDTLAAKLELDDSKPVNKEDVEKVQDSQKVQNRDLASNVHNTRRQQNRHMSENEIR